MYVYIGMYNGRHAVLVRPGICVICDTDLCIMSIVYADLMRVYRFICIYSNKQGVKKIYK